MYAILIIEHQCLDTTIKSWPLPFLGRPLVSQDLTICLPGWCDRRGAVARLEWSLLGSKLLHVKVLKGDEPSLQGCWSSIYSRCTCCYHFLLHSRSFAPSNQSPWRWEVELDESTSCVAFWFIVYRSAHSLSIPSISFDCGYGNSRTMLSGLLAAEGITNGPPRGIRDPILHMALD